MEVGFFGFVRQGGPPSRVGRGSDDDVIAEALQLLADFDNTPLPHMTPLFYEHGYEELRMRAAARPPPVRTLVPSIC